MELIELMTVFNDTMCQSVKGMLVNDRKMIVIETKGSSWPCNCFRRSTLPGSSSAVVWQKMHAHNWNECVRLPKPDVTEYLNRVKANRQKQTNKQTYFWICFPGAPKQNSEYKSSMGCYDEQLSQEVEREREREKADKQTLLTTFYTLHRIRFLGLRNRQQDLEKT